MKLRVIGLMAILFAGGAFAEEVHLICDGTTTVCDENGGCDSVDVIREVSFDEENGDFSYRRNGEDWKTKDIKFSDDSITGKVNGGWKVQFGSDIKFSLSRYTGVLTTDPKIGGGMTLQCRRVANERKF